MSAEKLLDECWETIFDRLDYQLLEPVSLVSKRFLSLSNRVRLHFSVVEPTILIHGTISSLLVRFCNLKSLDLSNLRKYDLDDIITQIAHSPLPNLESLDISNVIICPIQGLKELGFSDKKLKVLRCANMLLLPTHLIDMADCFLYLEELDISDGDFEPNEEFLFGPRVEFVTDGTIEVISHRLKSLRKVNISRRRLLTDKSVFSLSSNCLLLSEVIFAGCSLVTQNAINFLLQNSPCLSALSIHPVSIFQEVFVCFGRNLCTVMFKDCCVSDKLLGLIVKSCISLRSITLSGCSYTRDGISMLLRMSSLAFLDFTENPYLETTHFLTDDLMIPLSRYLRNLVCVRLNWCFKLSNLTLYALAKNCPLLESIEMCGANMGKEEDLFMNRENNKITSLDLGFTPLLFDDRLARIVSIFPNLRELRVSYCSSITETGISAVFRSCSKLRHLDVEECRVQSLGQGSDLSMLEVLLAPQSYFNDDGLVELAKTCKRLRKLDLGSCINVTERGVWDVVKSCEKLEEIVLGGCIMSVSIIGKMVKTRPSLKKITPPCDEAFTKMLRNHILVRYGCQICKDT